MIYMDADEYYRRRRTRDALILAMGYDPDDEIAEGERAFTVTNIAVSRALSTLVRNSKSALRYGKGD